MYLTNSGSEAATIATFGTRMPRRDSTLKVGAFISR